MTAPTNPIVKAALVIAHPGHELRLSAWVAQTRPFLFVVAKGSRSGRSESRLAASRATAAELGAVVAEPFGAAFDIELYDAIPRSALSTGHRPGRRRAADRARRPGPGPGRSPADLEPGPRHRRLDRRAGRPAGPDRHPLDRAGGDRAGRGGRDRRRQAPGAERLPSG